MSDSSPQFAGYDFLTEGTTYWSQWQSPKDVQVSVDNHFPVFRNGPLDRFIVFFLSQHFYAPWPDEWEARQEQLVHLLCAQPALETVCWDHPASNFLGRTLKPAVPYSKRHGSVPTLGSFQGPHCQGMGCKYILVLRILSQWSKLNFCIFQCHVLCCISTDSPVGKELLDHMLNKHTILSGMEQVVSLHCRHWLLPLAWCEGGSSFRLSSKSTPTLPKRTENW